MIFTLIQTVLLKQYILNWNPAEDGTSGVPRQVLHAANFQIECKLKGSCQFLVELIATAHREECFLLIYDMP